MVKKRIFDFIVAIIASIFSIAILSCAGTAGGGGMDSDETALSVRLPANRAAQWDKTDVQSFTVTISSSSYKDTKSAAGGETITFSAIPVGHYTVEALGKNSNGDLTAKGGAEIDIVADTVTEAVVSLNRLNFCTVRFLDSDRTLINSVKVTEGYTVACPEGPNVDFAYWKDDGGRHDFSLPVTEDLDLTAVYAVLSSISVSGSLTTTVFAENGAFNKSGISVIASFEDGTTADVTNDANTTFILAGGDNTKFTQIGTQPVTVSYTLGGITKTADVGNVTVKFTPVLTGWSTPVLNIDKSSVSTDSETFTLTMTTSYPDTVHTKYTAGGGETLKEVMKGEICFWTEDGSGNGVHGNTGYGASILGETGSVGITVADILGKSGNRSFSCVKFYLNYKWALVDSSNNIVYPASDYYTGSVTSLAGQTSTGASAPGVNYTGS